MAMKLIKANGIILHLAAVVCDKMLFYNTITSAALEAGRNIKVLHYLYQPADHPVTSFSRKVNIKGWYFGWNNS